MRFRSTIQLATIAVVAACAPAAGLERLSADDKLYVASPLTTPGEFTPGIEGPGCDKSGALFAVNYQREGTIGSVAVDGRSALFVDLPSGSVGNGIRFDRQGLMYVADYTRHNVLRIDPATRRISVFAHDDRMNQPNDLTIADDGTLYASDPNWKESTGQLWRITAGGEAIRLAEGMGTTNGIALAPDGRRLYVNESVQRNIWMFDVNPDGSLTEKRLLRRFEDHGFDGMRTDVDGNLYATRYGKGTVVVVSPTGEVIREIDILGARPSNIAFGGPDGRTAFVTEVEHLRIVQFRVERPGLEWQQLQDK